ncbi:unnamed protein product [Adineta steineri]|uniref:F-box domain-containing protein n=1 Tax=Adineta steineri TaxID=433720 RepID=A0A815BKH0_9BILA|nr:unnamed protein product [Adineta steineri]
MKNRISISSKLETFPNEIFFEIFDRLLPSDLYQAFYGLNTRLNTILNDSRMRFRDNISSLNSKEFHSYIQNILPQILNRLVSFTFGTYDTDEYQQASCFLHTYSIDLTHFQHLRTLVIIKMTISDVPIIQSAVIRLIHLVNLRLSVDSNDVGRLSVVNITNDLLLGSRLKHIKMDMCARIVFENINQISNIEQLSIVWCQLQELTHLLQYTPQLYTLKATISGLDNSQNWIENFPINFTQQYNLRLRSLKLVIDSILFDHLLLFLQQLTELRSLWLLLNHYEYMNVDKWENLFKSSLVKLDQLDLTIALMKPILPVQTILFSTPSLICEKFNTKFWFDRGWCAKLHEYDHCIRLIVLNNMISTIKRLKRQ